MSDTLPRKYTPVEWLIPEEAPPASHAAQEAANAWLNANPTAIGDIGVQRLAVAMEAYAASLRPTLPTEAPEGFVRASIEVTVYSDGDWVAVGYSEMKEGLPERAHTVTVIALVPLPPAPPEVVGVVEGS